LLVCAVTLDKNPPTDAREECWHLYYGDVRAGTIAISTGIPRDEDPWGLGFKEAKI
jgi:hypothetical protein